MDALKQVLYALRLKPQMFYRLNLAAPWGLHLSVINAAAFHVVEAGHCWLRQSGRADKPPIALDAGDLIVVSNNAAYELVDDPLSNSIPARELLARNIPNAVLSLSTDTSGSHTTLICGEFRPDQDGVHPLFALMPPLILIKNHDGKAIEWLATPLALIASEAASSYPGYEIVISRLMDILFIMVIRYWITHESVEQGGWLRALYDPQFGQVLSRLHDQPAHNWTVNEMADLAYMSRSTFSARFTALVGEPPMMYLTRWRLQLATMYLIDEPQATVEEIAGRVGYQSAYAFSKAFKRVVGLSPTEYRKQQARS